MFIFMASVSVAFSVASVDGTAAELFHNGGTGRCDGCHSKTRKSRRQAAPGTFAAMSSATEAGLYMLNGSDPGSTCLACHQAPDGTRRPSGYYVATAAPDLQSGPPVQLPPGGDFAWLKKSFKWGDSGGKKGSATGSSPGERHGHNIVAADYGYSADTVNIIVPEGSYPAEALTCTSCHDPHGTYRRLSGGAIDTKGPRIAATGSYKDSPEPDSNQSVGVYRLLAGKGYQPKSLKGDFSFSADPPAAVAPIVYNRSEATSDTRVAYGSGMSEWCRNCHTLTHGEKEGHPVGNGAKFSADAVDSYNSYISSGKSTKRPDSSFTSMVPFETGGTDYPSLKSIAGSDGSVLTGATRTSNVMCLTCHRAHASAWDHVGRWNFRSHVTTPDGIYPGTDTAAPADLSQGRTSQETSRGYYDRPAAAFGAFQRGLCSKCHAKD